MREWLTAVIIASMAAGITTMLAPENGGVRRLVRFCAALVVTLILLSPLKGAVEAAVNAFDNVLPEFEADEPVTLSEELYAEMVAETLEAVKTAVEDAIREKYSIKIEVTFDCDDSDYSSVKITGANVRINDADALYRDLTEKYITETLGCEVKFTTVYG